ncbi:class I SAM-dependent methyltransferase [Aspergillus undulatus]|uniref:class I SAM-dependent methyltransferase n=1 Tax=Aspergillus undulatus TaxID=1810928 RepID=UPI003CCCAD32
MGDAREPEQEIYPLARDEAESRLNAQHNFIVQATEGLINSAIPLDKISTVADVGTGTGIWLLEARKLLDTEFPSEPGSDRYFHGFDISPAQFIPSPPEGVELSVHDILKPFPPEHHNRYDLVNVRMLVAALTEPDYRTAVRNLTEILKPGGYLQWIELDCTNLPNSAECKDPHAAWLINSWLGFLNLNNLLVSPAPTLQDAYEKSGLLDVSNKSYPVSDRGDNLTVKAQKWQMHAFSSVIPLMMLRTAQVKTVEEGREKVGAEIRGLVGLFNEGAVIQLGFVSVVGRKDRDGDLVS